ncbi:MAG TPA: lactate racemase domain-containing protein [Candidatus Dormibacteraeota bacterium]|nr:lactate racemase domain-containing protein [Candidatus Dormibacteraeota bacterium]
MILRTEGFADIEQLLAHVPLPRAFRVERPRRTPPALADVREAVGDVLRGVEMPRGSVAVAVGSRGIGRIAEIAAAVVSALRAGGAEPFVIPAMGSHGGATAEGQTHALAALGVTEERIGCPIRSSMDAVRLGTTPAGVDVFMDAHAHAADAVVVINRVKPHTAFRGAIESGPAKMLAIGLGKQRGAHALHAAGWERMHATVPDAARVVLASGKVAFGLAILENADEQPYRLVALRAGRILDDEPALLEEAKRNLPRLPFDRLDALVVDRIGKNISGDGADPNVTGRYPTTTASGGPDVTRLVFLDLTDETDGNANGLGLADVVTQRLVERFLPAATYVNALTSTAPSGVRLPMVMPTPRLAVAAALTMCAGVDPARARVVRIQDTLHLNELWISESLLPELLEREAVTALEGPVPLPLPEPTLR